MVLLFVGVDYVAHEDIIPYINMETTPVEHELFDKLYMPDPEHRKFLIK